LNHEPSQRTCNEPHAQTSRNDASTTQADLGLRETPTRFADSLLVILGVSLSDRNLRPRMAAVGMRYQVLPKEPVVVADEILTLAEVAAFLKVAGKTVYTMAQKSELPCFKVRGQWRFRRQDLDSWMASQVKARELPSSRRPSPKRRRGREALVDERSRHL
jgi:excisionase family DNA binding protein